MSDKMFKQILAAIIIMGIIGTVTMAAYTVYRHNNCSIITYIGNEG